MRNKKKYNIAADIVVNDILHYSRYDSGSLPKITGKQFKIDGVHNTVEEVYEKLEIEINEVYVINHNYWDEANQDKIKRILNEAKVKGYSSNSFYFNRVLDKVYKSTTNWKNILNDILSLNEKDYTFEKVEESYGNILLPTFNKSDFHLENVWLVVDASGSMNDKDVSKAYSEIVKIIKSFDSVDLKVSFFSTFVTKPKKVKSLKELKETFNKIESSGGTSFSVIFDKLNSLNKRPLAIIIITDGYAPMPDKKRSKGIPVFWAINNDDITPPFGHLIKV